MFGHLDFYNKNWYRRYPLRASSSFVSVDGTPLPDSLIAGLKITTRIDKYDVFVSKVFVKDNYVNITFSHKVDDTTTITLGYVTGVINDNNTTLEILPEQPYVSGHCVVGFKDSLSNIQGGHLIDFDNGQVEGSVVIPVNPPGVAYIQHNNAKASGFVTTKLTNIQVLDTPFHFGIVSTDLIASNNDNNASRLTCPTHIIRGINTVLPDTDGNIDIYGIEPVTITVTTAGVIIDTPGIGSSDICANALPNIPPNLEDLYPGILLADKNRYKGYLPNGNPQKSILTTDTPEFKDIWPQYQS